MRRTLTSWRLLVAGLGLSTLAVAGLAVNLEQEHSRGALQRVVADAELINEVLVEANLEVGDAPAERVGERAQRRLNRGVNALKRDQRLVGLQLWDRDGRLLYSDSRDPEPLSADEVALLAAVLDGHPQVELEQDGDRPVPTATVLLKPRSTTGFPTGIVAEILMPQDEVAAALLSSAHRLYGGTAALAVTVLLVAIGARRRMRRREHEALHDPLTGLGNRTLLGQASRCALAAGRRAGGGRVALLVLDLDGFKVVNDTLGHSVGDELLVRVGVALRSVVRPDDVVVRLGGDEFAVLLGDVPDAAAAVRVAEGVGEALQRPFSVEGVTLEVGASVGVAVSPEHGQDLEGLLRRADVAMYQAKREGGGARLYDEAQDPHDEAHLGLLAQLRHAIDDGQLRLHYQPKLSLREGRTVGFEALVRWEHPQHGLLGPGEFVPLAERTALLGPLTDWVLREAVAQCARWRAHGWDVDVAVNVAPATLLEQDFPEQVLRRLAAAGLPGSALELEITETAVMVDPVRAARTLRRLQAMGVAVSIDDFGAGYTSLSYLKSLPVRALKIDRGFVTNLVDDPKDEAVARSVVGLGHDLGLTVVAEGVESAEVRQRLLELGCDEIQGYLLARPMPVDDVEPWLRHQHAPDAAPLGEPVQG